MKRIFTTFVSIILLSGSSMAQDMVFSQMNRSSMLMNPARLSRENRLVFGGMYRHMGLIENVNVQSSFFFIESPVKIKNKRYGGFGVAMLNSNDGGTHPMKMTGGIVALNKRLQVTDNSYLSVGFQGGYYNKQLDYSNYSTGSQWIGSSGYNPNLPNGEGLLNESADIMNLNSGAYWMIPGRSGDMQSALGVSLQHINRPSYTFIRSGEPKPLTFQVHGRQRIYNNELFKASVSAMYRKGNQEWITVGSRLTYFFKKQASYNVLKFDHAGIEAHYNHNRSVVVVLNLSRKDMDFGFSYDFGLPGSLYEHATGGIIEFSLTMKSLFTEEKETRKKPKPEFVDAGERDFFDDEARETDKVKNQPNRMSDSIKHKIDSLQRIVNKEPEEVNIKLSKNFNFEFNDATLNNEAKQFLDNLALMLLKSPGLKVIVTGHSDNRGTKEDNLTISKRRSKSVAEYLIKRGVDNARITTEAKGATEPLVPNNSPKNREKNRRVEFEIYSE
jgi:type IX secretion system PorP/SprF family membrane protein